MVGNLQKKNLRGAEEQRRLDERRLRGRTAIEKQRDEMAQRAEPAQHRRDERARKRAVALGQVRQSPDCAPAPSSIVIERAVAAQHAVDDVGGDAARRETWYRVVDQERGPALCAHASLG